MHDTDVETRGRYQKLILYTRLVATNRIFRSYKYCLVASGISWRKGICTYSKPNLGVKPQDAYESALPKIFSNRFINF